MTDFVVQVFFGSVSALGHKALEFVSHLGRMAVFAGAVLESVFKPPFRIGDFWRELHKAGVLSLVVVCLSGLAVGMVLGLQGYHILTDYGAEKQLGAMVGMSLIRELGPVLAALLVTGRAGSAMTAGIATMVTTDQLDGLRMLSIDPIHLVIKPRAMAIFTVLPLLTAMFTICGVFGGYIAGVTLMGLDAGSYMTSLRSAATLEGDVAGFLIKSLAFGFLISIIATYRGYTSEPTSEGVSRATTATVVTASVTVLMFDYMITALWGV